MSLKDFVRLTAEAVEAIHDEVLSESGGLPGLSPDKSLESALYRVDNHALYRGVSDICEVAALYGTAIARGHVFNDGNKRTAFVSMVAVAEGEMQLPALAQWLRAGSRPIA